jgi:hypothetical protein
MSVESITSFNPGNSHVEVFYGDCRITPAPFIDWTVESQFDDSGTRTANNNKLTLTGSILILPSGSYEQMYLKQVALRECFAVDGLDFVIKAGGSNCTLPSGAIIASGLRPKVVSVNIAPDIHVTRFDYTIELEDLVAASGVSGVTSSLSNQWSFREDGDSCTLLVTHNVNAEGPDGEPDKFDQAMRAVQALLGIDKLPIQIPFFTEPNASGLFGFTHPSNPAGGPIFEVSVQREEVADVANGSYQVTEIFTIVNGVPFFFKSHTESFEEDANGITTVTIAGQVQGLGRTLDPSFGEDGGRGFARAVSGFNNVVRPQIPWDASGVYVRYKGSPTVSGLNIFSPQSVSISQNKCRGTIDFSFAYTDNPISLLPSGIASRTCSISFTEAIRLKASHVIPFRRLGNIIQDIKTPTEGSITIQCQVQAKNTGDSIADLNRAISFLQDELNRLKNIHANPADYTTIRFTNLSPQYSDTDLTASASVGFAFTVDLIQVPDVNADISLRTV